MAAFSTVLDMGGELGSRGADDNSLAAPPTDLLYARGCASCLLRPAEAAQ